MRGSSQDTQDPGGHSVGLNQTLLCPMELPGVQRVLFEARMQQGSTSSVKGDAVCAALTAALGSMEKVL